LLKELRIAFISNINNIRTAIEELQKLGSGSLKEMLLVDPATET
jgi:hypothetical protein